MSNNPRFPAEQAAAIALELRDELAPHCERIAIAGSLRRGKAEVGDVELLFIPRRGPARRPGDLFPVDCNFAEMQIEAWLERGTLGKRASEESTFSWGPWNKLALHVASGIPVDLFATTEANWWNSLVCRTGPLESNKAIAAAAIARGWTWRAYGAGFTRLYPNDEGRIEEYATRSEEDVFRFVGLPCLPPEQR